MQIIVCMKQVPDTTNVRINPETNTLMRDGVESIINPFDEYALEQALKIKDKTGAKVSILSMGPPQAVVVLQEAMARGADEGILLSDRAFAGADTLATSYALFQAIKKMNPHPDLLLFGKQAIDGDTAQVGPGVSEYLDMPLITNVRNIDVEGDNFRAETITENSTDIVEGKFPCVMTVVKEAAVPRFAKLSGWMKARKTPCTIWTAKDLQADPTRLGLNGSPTKVAKIFPPAVRECEQKLVWKTDKKQALTTILSVLKKKGALE